MAAAPVDSPTDGFLGEEGAPPFDRVVLFVTGVLMTLGVAMVYSASVTVAGAGLDWREWWHTPLRQCVFALAGFVGMLFAAHCDHRWLAWERRWDFWRAGSLYVLAMAMLVAVLLIGSRAHGAQRALVVFRSPFTLSFQPAELAKLVMVIWLAALLAQLQSRKPVRPGEQAGVRRFWRGFLPAILSAGLLIGLTGIEDFGTAALMGVIAIAMLVLAGARWWHTAAATVVGIIGGIGLIALKPYRWERIVTFFSGTPDPKAEGYQADQSLLAIGSGGWSGRGLGAGVQKYGYLPQKDNDFILSTICEELGVVAGLVIVGLFLVFLWRGWLLARRADTTFGQLLAAGLTLLICLQAAFNVGVVTDSVPTKGISLPFVSAGGSGVLFLGLAAGLLASIGRGGSRK